MPDIDLNKEYIDLDSTPAENDAGHLPVLSSENVHVITEERNDVQPMSGPTLIEISSETSSSPPKRRSCKRSQDLPDGWIVEERVRPCGKSAGKKDKYFIEPRTGKKFRSMLDVSRHLGIADPKPCNNKPRKFQVHGKNNRKLIPPRFKKFFKPSCNNHVLSNLIRYELE